LSATGAKLAAHPVPGVLPKGRNPLAHLFHALNQPLTGLQCSLELAASEPRSTDQYVRTLREGLELIGRMRILVEAIRELADTEPPDGEEAETFRLDELLRDTVNDLLPVAQSIGVRVSLVTSPLPVRAARRRLAALMFRLIDSGLSLARERSDLQIVAAPEPEHARLVVSWNQGPGPEHSPFSQPELGLLIAQAGWEQAGAEWSLTRAETTQTCTVRLPLASPYTAR
jgi:C4-dicarboxylate-specific signal transduction histidine kinase